MAHIKTSSKCQGVGYESVINLIGGSNILPGYTHYILENYGNLGHFSFSFIQIQRFQGQT